VPTQPPTQRVPGILSPLKAAEAWSLSPPSISKVQNE
jgi:hypothetical protein